jgi:hypothetical protein
MTAPEVSLTCPEMLLCAEASGASNAKSARPEKPNALNLIRSIISPLPVFARSDERSATLSSFSYVVNGVGQGKGAGICQKFEWMKLAPPRILPFIQPAVAGHQD